MKKIISIILTMAMIFSMSITILSYSPNNEKKALMGMNSDQYNTENNDFIVDNPNIADIVALEISTHKIILEDSSCFEFIDVIAEYGNGRFENVSNESIYYSLNDSVATAHLGRVMAKGIGTTSIIISYGDFHHKIEVSVLKSFAGNTDNNIKFRMNALRTAVTAKAKAMIDLSWTPSHSLVKWNGGSFQAGTTYTGIPYTQNIQVDEKIFSRYMTQQSNFYTPVTINSKTMPRYGNDCSGFLSLAWGIERNNTTGFISGIRNNSYKKIGNYNANAPVSSELITAYKNLQAGDAVVTQGHTFMIYANHASQNKVTCYEQTPDNARITTWTYTQMASNGYMPFTLLYMDSPITR